MGLTLEEETEKNRGHLVRTAAVGHSVYYRCACIIASLCVFLIYDGVEERGVGSSHVSMPNS